MSGTALAGTAVKQEILIFRTINPVPFLGYVSLKERNIVSKQMYSLPAGYVVESICFA